MMLMLCEICNLININTNNLLTYADSIETINDDNLKAIFTESLYDDLGFLQRLVIELTEFLSQKTFTENVKHDIMYLDAKDKWLTVENGEHVLLGEGGEIKAGLGGKFTGKKMSDVVKNPTLSWLERQAPPQAQIRRLGHRSPETVFGESVESLISRGQEKKAAQLLMRDLHKNSGKTVTLEKATELLNSTYSFTDAGFRDIRKAYTTPNEAYPKALRQLKAVDEFVEISPKWEGGPLYRGVRVSDSVIATYKVGHIIDMRGPSSWSSDEDSARTFSASSAGQQNSVIFTLPSTNKATSIKHLSMYPAENEVLASSNAEYTIKSIKKKDKKYYVNLEEN